MKLSVIALDYDGTVARDDALDPSVRDAIAAARTQGIVVLLVTGRILDQLRRVAGDLHFVDGVVAELALAGELRALEERYRATSRAETVLEMAGAVRGRYDLAEDNVEMSGT